MNEGLVTVTEVGKYKKEIAYHGDAINTAARIQGQCNFFKRRLLISESLKQKLSGVGKRFDKLGTVELKGKRAGVTIYAVSEMEQPKLSNVLPEKNLRA
ncbi:MAG: adenylate/guanylate cyclase domain-containing protein [Flammeovirgaceae bacterium]